MTARQSLRLLAGCMLLGACQPSASVPTPHTAKTHTPTAVAPVPTAVTVRREPPPATVAGAMKPFPAVSTEPLSNGLTVDLIERHAVPVVHLSLVVGAGHAQDDSHPGAARVMAQLLEAGGAGRWTSTKLREVVDNLGATLEIASTRDNLRWSLAVTSDRVQEALDVLAALAQSPRFDPEEFRKLKERELERVKSLAKTSGVWLAQYWLHRELYRQPVGIHPYASVDVLPSEVARLRLEDCKAFYRAQVVPSNARIIAVGDVTPQRLNQNVTRAFGAWRGAATTNGNIGESTSPSELRLFVVDRPASSQSDIQLGLAGPARSAADFPTVMTLQQILGGGVAGRLFLDIREKRSLAYATYAGIQEVAHGPSVLTLSAGTQTAKTSEAVGALLEHLDRLAADPGSLTELETAQNYLIRGMPARWETVESLAGQLLLLRVQGQTTSYFDELREQVSNLSTPVLKEPAARYYQRRQATIVVAGDADKIAADLRKFGPVEVLDPEHEFSVKRKLDRN